MINKLYGMLVAEALDTDFYYRNSTQVSTYVAELDILIPHSAEKAYRQFCANQLCEVVHASRLRAELQQMDPNNTYDHPPEVVTDEETLVVGIPDGVLLNVIDLPEIRAWVRKTITLNFDGVTTVTYAPGKSVEWGLTGTDHMIVDGVALAFSGPVPASAFVATVSLLRKPGRDLLVLLEQMDATAGTEWDETLTQYKDTTMPTTRLAAHILNTLTKI